eukprot:TRINITY_DN3865_c0_g1_i2.p1 TRINITY_DN3865_c0_g1~~TRINITY_DN3865_c0_g1_i2.p1  ORF type:complete len:476 (+),score=173.83 TRINITY_DN3865_c0_g1_i2:186-1613(+)
MSSIYALEPKTEGKVLLKTDIGEIEIELWPKECPKAVRNFVQLCMERYYDDCIFHRIEKDFIVQTGDPTNTGEGGESIYGKKGFKKELHSRLKFNHRGLVAMAKSDKSPNNSQFFITLNSCNYLTGEYTIFGKVVGSTIYNVLKMNDYEVDSNNRPIEPPKILSVDVVWNPFDDIIPRENILSKRKRETVSEVDQPKKKRRKKRKKIPKNTSLLSFGDDEDIDTDMSENSKVKLKSTFQSLTNESTAKKEINKLNDMISKSKYDLDETKSILSKNKKNIKSSSPSSKDDINDNPIDFDLKMKEKILQSRNLKNKQEQATNDLKHKKEEVIDDKIIDDKKSDDSDDDSDDEYSFILKKKKKNKSGSVLMNQRKKYQKSKNMTKKQKQAMIMKKLSMFKQTLKENNNDDNNNNNNNNEDDNNKNKKETVVDVSFFDDINEDDDGIDDNDPNWKNHSLKFKAFGYLDGMVRSLIYIYI